MDEVEAAAVMLALGPQLTWDDRHNTCQHIAWLGIAGLPPAYAVNYDLVQEGYEACHVIRDDPSDDTDRRFHATVELAKAACELHHATGNWQSV